MTRAADHSTRAADLRLLSVSSWTDLDASTTAIASTPHQIVRGPETGLVMLRGRMGSTGAAFNLGEATVTRCTVRLANGTEGHAYVMGRNQDHARRAAICDALFRSPGVDQSLRASVLKPLEAKLHASRLRTATKAAATKVDFFTLVRGDD